MGSGSENWHLKTAGGKPAQLKKKTQKTNKPQTTLKPPVIMKLTLKVRKKLSSYRITTQLLHY